MSCDQAQAIELFFKLRQCAHTLPEPVANWLIDAFDGYIKQPPNDRKTLDHYLGLSSERAGQRTAATQIQRIIRDSHLHAAANHLQALSGGSKWNACGKLADEIKRFRTTRLRRLRSGDALPCNDLEQSLLAAFEFGVEPPTTQDRLYSIVTELARNPIYLCHTENGLNKHATSHR
ncbi:MAG: hypothetical protein ACR65R_19890 [Methylomicrobium sp.]